MVSAAVRNRRFQAIYDEADQAGQAAAEAVVPVPMVVVQRANPWDDSSPIVREYAPVMDGVCGFAWVAVLPGTSSFARWLVKEGKARKAYGGGVSIWVSRYNQSMTRKEAYAHAFAGVCRKYAATLGTDRIYGQSRMD